jgi:hypothetical protein
MVSVIITLNQVVKALGLSTSYTSLTNSPPNLRLIIYSETDISVTVTLADSHDPIYLDKYNITTILVKH